MSAREMTLSRFLKWDEKSKTAQIGSNLDSKKEEIVAEISVPWEPLKEKMVEEIVKLLDLPLKDFCLAAWKKNRELQQFADREKYPPDETNKVNLIEHEITGEYHPTVEVSFAGKTFPKLKFDLNVSLKLTGCVLTIQDGKIKEILPGNCQGEAVLQWKKAVLAKATTETVDIGGEIKLEKPIAISAI
jgi:hypothetical protein